MKKAIGDNLIPDGWSLEKGLDLIKKTGCDGVELWLGGKPWFQMNTPDGGVHELFRKVRDAGLTVSTVCNTLDWDENLSARDPKVQAAAIRHIERQIETAQMLETDAILVVAGLVTEEVPYNEVYARVRENLKRLAETARTAARSSAF
jgi:sugar phosphate isomerase/epimerase